MCCTVSHQKGELDAESAVKLNTRGSDWSRQVMRHHLSVESPVHSVPLKAHLAHIRLGHLP